jgi:hypothetical protein
MMTLALFVVGFVTWSLCFARSMAWDARHTGWLCCVVAVDESIGILTGMWLAKHGTYVEGLACALGGVLAAYVMLRKGKR